MTELSEVILVDEQDVEAGQMEKNEAHRKGLLHRAFSVFIFNSKGDMLLQQRALHKYHSGGLWSNSCCSHPRPGEDILTAAQRRLREEMGFSVPLVKAFDFIYRAHVGDGLIEHEYDHVFLGKYDGPVEYDKIEVMDYRYEKPGNIRQQLREDTRQYTIWFQLAFPKIDEWLRQQKNIKSKM